MEDILAILLIFGGATCVGLAFSPLGRALADRLRHGVQPLLPPEQDSEMWEEIERLRADMSEVQERLDFSERLLSQGNSTPEQES